MLNDWGWADPPPVDESASSGDAVAVVFARLDARAILTLRAKRGSDHVPTQGSVDAKYFFGTALWSPTDRPQWIRDCSERGIHPIRHAHWSMKPIRPDTDPVLVDFSFWTQTGEDDGTLYHLDIDSPRHACMTDLEGLDTPLTPQNAATFHPASHRATQI